MLEAALAQLQDGSIDEARLVGFLPNDDAQGHIFRILRPLAKLAVEGTEAVEAASLAVDRREKEAAQEVNTVETSTGSGKYVPVVTRTALTPVFWSTQGGAPVVLPAMAEKRADASETRARWEGKERKMLAIGGWDGANMERRSMQRE